MRAPILLMMALFPAQAIACDEIQCLEKIEALAAYEPPFTQAVDRICGYLALVDDPRTTEFYIAVDTYLPRVHSLFVKFVNQNHEADWAVWTAHQGQAAQFLAADQFLTCAAEALATSDEPQNAIERFNIRHGDEERAKLLQLAEELV